MRTTTTLTVASTSVKVTQPLTVNVAVAPADPAISGGAIPSGQVGVQGLGGALQCGVALDSGGRGSCVLTPTQPGLLTLTGQYEGDSTFAVSAGVVSVIVVAIPPPVCGGTGPTITFYAPNQTCQSWWFPDATGMPATLTFSVATPGIVSVVGNPSTLPPGYSGPYPPAAQYIATWIAGTATGSTTVQVLATHPDGSRQYYRTWSVTNSY